ncbi:MAG: hypothetical protein EZS28_006989 [Streblomastix strix]|uniref:RRM domain-containing protein n=1 Tax=Streblomastix strix TaxID=222440 RepID=A0A5J4WSU3_9EUKA|nr:MAG: hypothetical protein EZS28_006989 [Streblomastix strix]
MTAGTLIIQNLNKKTTAETIEHLFERIGEVDYVRIESEYGVSKGIGYAKMANFETALKIIEIFHMLILDDNQIRIELENEETMDDNNQNKDKSASKNEDLTLSKVGSVQSVNQPNFQSNLNQSEQIIVVPQDYNVGGLTKLGSDIWLEIINDTTDLRDVQQMLCINKKIYSLKEHPRFRKSVENGLSQNTCRRILVIGEPPHNLLINTIPKPDRTERDKQEILSVIIDLTTKVNQNLNYLSQLIKKVSIVPYYYYGKDLTQKPTYYVFYINGLNQLKMKPIMFNKNLQYVDVDLQIEQDIKIELPPESVQFVDVQSRRQYSMALTIDGQLWSCYMNDDGFHGYSTGGQWRVNPHLIAQNELTDTNKMKPKFIDEVRGQLSDEVGPFGVFGTFHVVKCCGGQSFLTADGIVIQKVYQDHYEKSYLYTPIDPKWFFGERIADIHYIQVDSQDCWFSYRVYITLSGKVIILFHHDEQLYTDTIIEVLSKPDSVFQLPFPLSEMTTSIVGDWGYISVLKKDGQIININFRDEVDCDVTDYITELANADGALSGMKIKEFQSGSMFLFG